MRAELTLTPVEADAGADMTFEFPNLSPAQQEVHAAVQRARAQGLDPATVLGGLGGLGQGGDGSGAGLVNVGLEWDLFKVDLPVAEWPEPTLDMWSPLSTSSRWVVGLAQGGNQALCVCSRCNGSSGNVGTCDED